MTRIVSRGGFTDDAFAALERHTPDTHVPGAALQLGPEADLAALGDQIAQAPLIEVAFSSFADGRGFSIAARLRRGGYRGHLRAVGPLLVDQFRAALRQGFDDIALPDDHAARQPEAQWRAVPQSAGYRDRLFTTA